jgi:hypothetical protein
MIRAFLGNVLAGVVASIVTLLAVYIYRARSYRRRYAGLEGRYAHLSIAGEPLGDGITIIRYLGKNILATRGEGTDGWWQGRIIMCDDAPEYGTGVYQYEGKADCGRHEIQAASDGQTIFVYGLNTSHGKDFTFAYIWKRLHVGKA